MTPDEIDNSGDAGDEVYSDRLLDLISDDLDASRDLFQRLVGISDALLAAALTVAGLFVGFSFNGGGPILAVSVTPLVLILGVVDASNWVHMRRVAARIRSLEGLVHSFVVVEREHGVARNAALENLQYAVDGYQFGVERAFRRSEVREILASNATRGRSLVFILLALACFGAGLIPRSSNESQVCVIVIPAGSAVPTSVSSTTEATDDTSSQGWCESNPPPPSVGAGVTTTSSAPPTSSPPTSPTTSP